MRGSLCVQWKLQQIGPSIRRSPYLHERMFPRFREQIGNALDLFVEFSTLGEYRLGADAIPGASSAPADAPGQAPQLGGAGAHALRAAVRRTVAGGATGAMPVATPAARRLMQAASGRPTVSTASGRPAASAASAHRAASAAFGHPAASAASGRPAACSGDRHRRRLAAERRAATDAPARGRLRKGSPATAEQLCFAV
jgi:hypothetical protein